MDVHCSTCGEPWDVYHLQREAVFETALTAVEAESWLSLSSRERLSDPYRKRFKEVGYEFGNTIVNVIRCPCCPKGAQAQDDRVATKAALEELFDDDEDGLAAIYEDFRL